MSRTTATTRPLRFLFSRASSTRASVHTVQRISRLAGQSRSHKPKLPLPASRQTTTAPFSNHFHTTSQHRKGLRPETSDPEPPSTTASPTATSTANEPTPLSTESYHELADNSLDRLVAALEEKAETNAEYEVEYSAGVLSIETPLGTWIINKQPPNKQIWLSSPVSGPKRYDYVAAGAGQDAKEGSDVGAIAIAVEGRMADFGDGGRWVYLRDGSGLSELLREEVEVVVPGVGEE